MWLMRNAPDDGCRYKTFALCHLAYIYLRPIFAGAEADHISLLMIVFGYLVSMAATHALGVDGTYFTIELGFLEADYNFVKCFPCVARSPTHPPRRLAGWVQRQLSTGGVHGASSCNPCCCSQL